MGCAMGPGGMGDGFKGLMFNQAGGEAGVIQGWR